MTGRAAAAAAAVSAPFLSSQLSEARRGGEGPRRPNVSELGNGLLLCTQCRRELSVGSRGQVGQKNIEDGY